MPEYDYFNGENFITFDLLEVDDNKRDALAKTLNSHTLPDILSVGTNKGFQNIPIGMKAKNGVGL